MEREAQGPAHGAEQVPEGLAAEILAALAASTAHYEAGSARYFDLFSPDATFFSAGEPLRLDTRQAFESAFGPHLGEQLRAYHFLGPRIQPLPPDGAVFTSHVRYRVNFTFVDMRLTLVLARRQGAWQAIHLHLSPLPSSADTGTTGLAEDVTQIVATAAVGA